jgi:hypothetical protein
MLIQWYGCCSATKCFYVKCRVVSYQEVLWLALFLPFWLALQQSTGSVRKLNSWQYGAAWKWLICMLSRVPNHLILNMYIHLLYPMLLWPLEWFFSDLYVFQAADTDSAISPGVGLLFTICPHQLTKVLLPALQEASNSILRQEYAVTCTDWQHYWTSYTPQQSTSKSCTCFWHHPASCNRLGIYSQVCSTYLVVSFIVSKV